MTPAFPSPLSTAYGTTPGTTPVQPSALTFATPGSTPGSMITQGLLPQQLLNASGGPDHLTLALDTVGAMSA